MGGGRPAPCDNPRECCWGQARPKAAGNEDCSKRVGCDLVGCQIEFEVKNEEQATQMFEKELADFDMTKLTKVEVVGQGTTREGRDANVKVSIRVSPDPAQWKSWSTALRVILDKTKSARASYVYPEKGKNKTGSILRMPKQLEGCGTLICALASTAGNRTDWDVYRVPEPMGAVIETVASNFRYRLLCVLLDKDNKEIARCG